MSNVRPNEQQHQQVIINVLISTSNIVISYDETLLHLKQLANPDNLIRNKAEDYFSSLKYELNLYEVLFNIFKMENVEKYFRVQSILLIKNLIRLDLTAVRMRRTNENEPFKEVNLIVDFIQKELIELINLGKYDDTYKSHLKEIFLLVGDKKFPANWPDLLMIFSKIYQFQTENFVMDDNSFKVVFNLNELFYSLLKQNNRKRTPQARSKFLQYKQCFIEMFCPFYEKVSIFFNENSGSFNNLEFVEKYLNLMIMNDKIILVMIDSCFYINDFHKDEKLLVILKTVLDRTYSLLNQINNNPVNEIKELLQKNSYKIIKSLAKIQSSSPVLFYKELGSYVNILMLIIVNCNYFSQDILKTVFFGLYKVINTISYKELTEENSNIQCRKGSMPNTYPYANSFIESTSRTPEKPKRSALPLLVSPSKFKNFETELKQANEIFFECFKEENVRQLLDNFLKKVPFVFKKETDNLELELLAEIEEDMVPSEIFSTNTMSWQMLYKNLLESLISNFPDVCLKYIKEVLELLYSSQQTNEYGNNILIIDSVIYFINLLPNLYKSAVISEVDMIDYNQFITYIESFLNKSELLMKKYIVTISKWSEVLISNDTIFNYIENIMFFLNNSKNNIILLECCLALKNIITQFDNFLKSGYTSLNTHVDKRKLEESIKTKINWGNILVAVSTVCLNFMPSVKSAELMLALVNLFTSLLQKCHFQCDGKIIEILQNSKLSDIIHQLNNEFAQNAFIEMWKSLLVSFSNSSIILDLTLQFVSISLKREINTSNLGLLLFTLRIVETTDEIRNLLLNFLKEHITIFQTPTKQYLSVVLFNILEEFCLMDIFDVNDVTIIVSLCQEKFIPLYEMSKDLLQKQIDERRRNEKNNLNISSIQKSNEEFIFADLSEFKASIVNVVNTLYVFFANEKSIDITSHLKVFIRIIFEEILLFKEGRQFLSSATFITSIIPLVNRISILHFEFFSQVLDEFLIERGLQFDQFFSIWLNTMDQVINSESRALNVIAITKFMPLLDKQTFLSNLSDIFNICLMTVYSEMMRKIVIENTNCRTEKLVLNIPKSLNIRQSIRKKVMFENELLNKIDLHSFFVENLKISLMNMGVSIEDLVTNIMKDHRLISTLKNVLEIEL